jgi:Cu(I)/Ag(I) efflux system periplasmic protein CusF
MSVPGNPAQMQAFHPHSKEHSMNHMATHILVATGMALGASVFAAGDQGGGHPKPTSAAAPAKTAPVAAGAAGMAEGEVRRLDKSAGKITLKHGEIKNLDMPPMTMVFGVSDPALLDKVKQGDKVRFRVANEQGRFTITDIQAAAQ